EASTDATFDSFMFQLRFGGSSREIQDRQRQYLAEFNREAPILDLGCGRGEFLQLLIELGFTAKGVEIDPDMVAYCQKHNLPVEHADAIDYLAGLADNSLGGVFLGQVVEHMPPTSVVRLVDLAFRKLQSDGRFVVETINPMCVYALTRHFLM